MSLINIFLQINSFNIYIGILYLLREVEERELDGLAVLGLDEPRCERAATAGQFRHVAGQVADRI